MKINDIQSAARVSSRLTVIGWQLIMRLAEQAAQLIGLLWGGEAAWLDGANGWNINEVVCVQVNHFYYYPDIQKVKVNIFIILILALILKFLLQKTFWVFILLWNSVVNLDLLLYFSLVFDISYCNFFHEVQILTLTRLCLYVHHEKVSLFWTLLSSDFQKLICVGV